MVKALAFTPAGPGVLHLDGLPLFVSVPVFERMRAIPHGFGDVDTVVSYRMRTFRLSWWQCDVKHMNHDWSGWDGVQYVVDRLDRSPYYRIPVYREERP